MAAPSSPAMSRISSYSSRSETPKSILESCCKQKKSSPLKPLNIDDQKELIELQRQYDRHVTLLNKILSNPKGSTDLNDFDFIQFLESEDIIIKQLACKIVSLQQKMYS